MSILTITIALALIMTVLTLGLGLLSMAVGGRTDNQLSERFMWTRIGTQSLSILLIAVALYFASS